MQTVTQAELNPERVLLLHQRQKQQTINEHQLMICGRFLLTMLTRWFWTSTVAIARTMKNFRLNFFFLSFSFFFFFLWIGFWLSRHTWVLASYKIFFSIAKSQVPLSNKDVGRPLQLKYLENNFKITKTRVTIRDNFNTQLELGVNNLLETNGIKAGKHTYIFSWTAGSYWWSVIQQ